MAYIRPLKTGNFRADVRMKCIIKNKTFPSRQLAEGWASALEQNINAIPLMDNVQLLALTDDNIEVMGGAGLFLKLNCFLILMQKVACGGPKELIAKKSCL